MVRSILDDQPPRLRRPCGPTRPRCWSGSSHASPWRKTRRSDTHRPTSCSPTSGHSRPCRERGDSGTTTMGRFPSKRAMAHRRSDSDCRIGAVPGGRGPRVCGALKRLRPPLLSRPIEGLNEVVLPRSRALNASCPTVREPGPTRRRVLRRRHDRGDHQPPRRGERLGSDLPHQRDALQGHRRRSSDEIGEQSWMCSTRWRARCGGTAPAAASGRVRITPQLIHNRRATAHFVERPLRPQCSRISSQVQSDIAQQVIGQAQGGFAGTRAERTSKCATYGERRGLQRVPGAGLSYFT